MVKRTTNEVGFYENKFIYYLYAMCSNDILSYVLQRNDLSRLQRTGFTPILTGSFFIKI